MSEAYERHPWNAGFTWPEQAGPFRTVTDEQAAGYDTDGYFVMEHAFDAETIAAASAALEPLDQEVVDFLRTRPDGRFSIAGIDTVSIALHPSLRSAVLRAFCAARLFARLCLDLVGPDARLYWDQAVFPKEQGRQGASTRRSRRRAHSHHSTGHGRRALERRGPSKTEQAGSRLAWSDRYLRWPGPGGSPQAFRVSLRWTINSGPATPRTSSPRLAAPSWLGSIAS